MTKFVWPAGFEYAWIRLLSQVTITLSVLFSSFWVNTPSYYFPIMSYRLPLLDECTVLQRICYKIFQLTRFLTFMSCLPIWDKHFIMSIFVFLHENVPCDFIYECISFLTIKAEATSPYMYINMHIRLYVYINVYKRNHGFAIISKAFFILVWSSPACELFLQKICIIYYSIFSLTNRNPTINLWFIRASEEH